MTHWFLFLCFFLIFLWLVSDEQAVDRNFGQCYLASFWADLCRPSGKEKSFYRQTGIKWIQDT